MEKISSPEQLNDYIRVSNPGVWMILFCIIILLIGMCVWGVFGRFETTLEVSAISKSEGTIYEDGTPEQIFNNPQREKTRAFVKRLRAVEYQINSADFDLYQLNTLQG